MRIIKNRLVIAFICILLAGVLMFVYSASVKSESVKTQVVTVKNDIKKGDIITAKMLETKTIGGYNISKEIIKDEMGVIGKYALADFVTGDYIIDKKIAKELPSANEKLLNLDGSRVAISVAIKAFANGLSDKLVAGDIVSCIVTKDDTTTVPPQLTYVEVLTTTTGAGVDKEKSTDKVDDNLATVTLLATIEQAKLLAEYNSVADLHLTLVYRGNQAKQQFLDLQSEVLANGKTDSDNRK